MLVVQGDGMSSFRGQASSLEGYAFLLFDKAKGGYRLLPLTDTIQFDKYTAAASAATPAQAAVQGQTNKELAPISTTSTTPAALQTERSVSQNKVSKEKPEVKKAH